MPLRRCIQQLLNCQKLPQLELRSRPWREDEVHGLRAIHGDEALEALGGHEALPLPRHDLREDGLGPLVLLEVITHRLQELVHRQNQPLLEPQRHKPAPQEVGLDLLVRSVRLSTSLEGSIGDGENDVLHVVEARVLQVVRRQVHALHPGIDIPRLLRSLCLLRLRGAVGIIDFTSHVLRGVLHENSGVRVRLGHLLLALLEPVEHVVRQDDGLVLDARSVAVLPRKHVDLALVHAQLADVCLKEEDVGALHERVQDLSGSELVLEAPHDLAALLDTRQRRATRDVERLRPVAHGLARDVIRAPHELHTLHVHPCCLPDLHKVLPNNLDLLEVAAHLVVHQRKPVSNPEDKGPPSPCALVDVHGLEHPLRDVHAP
mmetsp:Transcript_861/g.2071  ORF Transcript_861/g.2071 Transcript_861/m.2071 type:complete len:375 (-) Transcript_861:248-1372(-)